MNHYVFINTLFLLALAVTVRAQVTDDDRKRILADSIRADYEQWLLHEPKQTLLHDSTREALRSLPPTDAVTDPQLLQREYRPVNINIMTPAFKIEMQLASQSHFLEEQRKAQQGGAMTIGINPLVLVGWTLSKLFPNRKSKKAREREKLKQVLDNY